jgi:hypothetical protein
VLRFNLIQIAFFLFGVNTLFSQEKQPTDLVIKDTTSLSKSTINPLAPAKAAFYSAILPGLGQAYNKKYWKIPIVYGALGSGIGIYVWNNNRYNEFRDAYKQRLAGISNPIYDRFTEATLISAQKTLARNRDISMVISVGLYILNIVDANVDAHLKQFNVDTNLSLRPDIIPTDITNEKNVGLTLNYRF